MGVGVTVGVDVFVGVGVFVGVFVGVNVGVGVFVGVNVGVGVFVGVGVGGIQLGQSLLNNSNLSFNNKKLCLTSSADNGSVYILN